MKKLVVIIALLLTVSGFAADGKSLAKKLGISASSKASVQWNRVFKKDRKMKKYGIDTLNDDEKAALQVYLVNHAADSDTPEVAGM